MIEFRKSTTNVSESLLPNAVGRIRIKLANKYGAQNVRSHDWLRSWDKMFQQITKQGKAIASYFRHSKKKN